MQEVWRRGRLYKNTVPYLIQVSSDLVSNLFLDIQHVRLYKDEKKKPLFRDLIEQACQNTTYWDVSMSSYQEIDM